MAWLDSNVAFDTRESRLICELQEFLCRFRRCFASHHPIYLHQSTFCVQFVGVLLGLIPGISECTRMLLRPIRSVYSVQVNCVTDLGVCCPPLGLVVLSGQPEGQLVAA